MHEDKKIEIMNILIDTMHFPVSPLSYPSNTKTILHYTMPTLKTLMKMCDIFIFFEFKVRTCSLFIEDIFIL